MLENILTMGEEGWVGVLTLNKPSQYFERSFGTGEALDLLNLCIRIINLAFVNLEYEDN